MSTYLPSLIAPRVGLCSSITAGGLVLRRFHLSIGLRKITDIYFDHVEYNFSMPLSWMSSVPWAAFFGQWLRLYVGYLLSVGW
jgi:hypothetical protein